MNTESINITKRYVLLLKRCLQFYHEKSAEKAISHTHSRRGLLFLQEFPVDGMKLTGVKLWKYRDIVNSGDLGKIKKIATAPDGIKEAPVSQQDIANSVIDNIIETWKITSEEEKLVFTKQIQELLKLYTSLLLLEKGELAHNKLKSTN